LAHPNCLFLAGVERGGQHRLRPPRFRARRTDELALTRSNHDEHERLTRSRDYIQLTKQKLQEILRLTQLRQWWRRVKAVKEAAHAVQAEAAALSCQTGTWV
jgi:hypothetical protein